MNTLSIGMGEFDFFYSDFINMIILNMILFLIICQRSSDPFYIIAYYIKWVTTSWTFSMNIFFRGGPHRSNQEEMKSDEEFYEEQRD